jgi:allophanate hydrolase subunit 1
LLTWDVNQTNPVFREGYALFRAGDRIRLIPIEEKEYLRIEENINTYPYEIEDGVYSRGWLKRK